MTSINRFRRCVHPHAFVIALALLQALGFAQVVAAAEELPREAALPLALANKAAAAAQEKCKQDGYRVSVAVGDRGGVLKGVMRGGGGGPPTTKNRSKKAHNPPSPRPPARGLGGIV